ncbi:MAG TPA: ABC transporter permease subunit [Luteolibacter sp.]|nr:ABC transporter permease subunit [Luteolibacter sp.]
MRLTGIYCLLLGILAIIGELCGIALPTARWFFHTSRNMPLLHLSGLDSLTMLNGFPWFGWVGSLLMIVVGAGFTIRSFTHGQLNPQTLRRLKRFREIKRGYWSLIILCALVALASLDQLVVGKRALAVRCGGEWSFPALRPGEFKNKDFGIGGEEADAPVNYRLLKKQFEKARKGDLVILPIIPYDPTGDTLPARSLPLERDATDCYREAGVKQAYYGLAARYHDVDLGRIHIRYTLRNGRLSGPVDGWDTKGNPVYNAEYRDGRLIRQQYSGKGTVEKFLESPSSALRAIKYHPAPPMPGEKHWLGTTSQGYDVLAYLYGGLQVNFKAAIIFVPIIYLIGVTLGMLMGFFGGWFDLTVQRVIEIFSNMPFLFVVIILSSMVPDKFKGLPVILTILVIFGWMGITYLMRTAAYRDRERDYIAAARVLGAGTPRIILRHLLPNTVAIIVTLIPFTISGLIFALTSLDYLGFGLPPEYATWGRLLSDGLSNLSAPWLVTSTFTVLVATLVLITFVGEAVREAFDPKKFTYYR